MFSWSGDMPASWWFPILWLTWLHAASGTPRLKQAHLTIEATGVIVDFDRFTLQGATLVDTNGDAAWDMIDYSTALGFSAFDCAKMFAVPTVLLIGAFPSTTCVWVTESQIQINLQDAFSISVGDYLTVLNDTIYSPTEGLVQAATGAVQIGAPASLEAPLVILTGATTIDSCSPVQLVSDSYGTGRLPTYSWALGTSQPVDVNASGRVADPTKLQLLQQALSNATNMDRLDVPSEYLEESMAYSIRFAVTSRWGLTSSKEVVLTKLPLPSPMVWIHGPTEVSYTRADEILLDSVAVPSQCASAKVSYRWDSSDLNLDELPGIFTSSRLRIPPFLLEPGNYTFTVHVGSTSASVSVTLITEQVPISSPLTVANPRSRYPVTSTIEIMAPVESATHSWKIFELSPNSLHDPDQATGAAQYIYVDRSDLLSPGLAKHFEVQRGEARLIIQNNTLKASTKYRVSLLVASSFMNVSIETAGPPPEKGRLMVAPLDSQLNVPRRVWAPDWLWVGKDLPSAPFRYSFGYRRGEERILASSQASWMELPCIPLGNATVGFAITLFVEVCSAAGACSRAEVAARSLPPATGSIEDWSEFCVPTTTTTTSSATSEPLRLITSGGYGLRACPICVCGALPWLQ